MPKLSRKTAVLAGAAVASVISLAGWWVRRDYHAWRSLGAGGLPGNFGGWLKTTRMRLQQCSPLDVTTLRRLQHGSGDAALLGALPQRQTPRPRVGPHPVPHRQLTQRAEPQWAAALQEAFDRAVEENGERVHYALSHFERHTRAVTRREQERPDPLGGASQGEIGHIHALDGSMHMILSPTDAIAAIEAGWAELHGLAGKIGLPATYVMVYAPQNHEDVAMAARLLGAAIEYMTQRPGLKA